MTCYFRCVDSEVKIFKLSVFASIAFGANLHVLSKDESSEILQRKARAMNNLHFEEVMPGNLERECIEETCDSQGHDSAHWKSRKWVLEMTGLRLRISRCCNYIGMTLLNPWKRTLRGFWRLPRSRHQTIQWLPWSRSRK